jgi:hypothetical protein
MRRNNIFAWLLAALLFATLPLHVAAQEQTTKPIKLKAPKPKIEKFKGTVFQFTPNFIIVRSKENERVVRNFSYTPEVREQMLKIVNQGGYQYGDKVEIHCSPGGNVALKIKGKPSKPRR